ncbi:hypothetical protein L6E12_23440 [Actinokineospora sp. PR83]|uniref:hypothetical protein n=1 Tax=Actinokineospora sp. PR83 TaxID=2884908 RepID=UPI0027DF342A|nr:hypothetical protein [Actinokineospora sp. PR83]MCG8918739.1 hypothetical protein [Actinokineospora sp. PR83]
MNAWLWATAGTLHELDARVIARYERGAVRWPGAHYRAALRHALGARTDAALGFRPSSRHTARSGVPTTATWTAATMAENAITLTQDDLMPTTRRALLTGTAALSGTALLTTLRPLLDRAAAGTSAFTSDELIAAEELVRTLRSWHSANAVLARSAVIAQLHSHMGGLRTAPQGTPSTCRAFRVGAELADIVASMAADATEPVTAQRYFVLAVQLAHVAGDDALAAVTLASLARQCFDQGSPDDGLEMVQLAQYTTRRTATPRLRALLATRVAYARQGQSKAFLRTVAVAEDHHSEGLRDADRATGLIDGVLPLAVPRVTGRVGSRLVDFHRESAVLASNPTVRGIRDAITDLVPTHRPSRGTPCA